MTLDMPTEAPDTAQIDRLVADLAHAKAAVGRRIFGQDRVIELALTALLAGGHALLIGVPGVAKTRLVGTIGAVLGLDTKRVQFTPDLMPSDIIGAEVLEESEDGKRAFRFIRGPVFTQLLMADEINRASPRTQSALLQAMQERQVTVAGTTYDLPRPFQVLATQNPIEQEGTYPLPEAQLDRFLLSVDVAYPDAAAERAMLIATTGVSDAGAEPVLTRDRLLAALKDVRGTQRVVANGAGGGCIRLAWFTSTQLLPILQSWATCEYAIRKQPLPMRVTVPLAVPSVDGAVKLSRRAPDVPRSLATSVVNAMVAWVLTVKVWVRVSDSA